MAGIVLDDPLDEEELEVTLGPGMTFAVSVLKHQLRLITVEIQQFQEMSREFMHLFFFSPPDSFVSWTKAGGEVSLIIDEATLQKCPQLCESTNAPDGSDGECWRALQVHDGADALGTPIAQTGVVSKLSEPLAAKGIAILYIGTLSCDYILVPEMQLGTH